MQDKEYIKLAIEQARKSVEIGGFPAGAILVKDDKIIGEGISIGNILHDPTSHGETQCVRNACKNLNSTDMSGATLYASMETCGMCLYSCMWANIGRIVYALPKDNLSNLYYGGQYKTEDINNLFNNKIDISCIEGQDLKNESLEIVKEWESRMSK